MLWIYSKYSQISLDQGGHAWWLQDHNSSKFWDYFLTTIYNWSDLLIVACVLLNWSIGSGTGLFHVRGQAITLTNVGLMSIGSWETYIHGNIFQNAVSAKWPFWCLNYVFGLNKFWIKNDINSFDWTSDAPVFWRVVPADTWHNNNVIITSKRRCDVVLVL